MKEIWKALPYRSKYSTYEISSLGNVRATFKNGKSKILKPIKANNKSDYLKVNINGKSKLIHRLVAETFIPNPSNFREVNHKDENQANNCINNLEWCEHKYNINYGTNRKRCGEKCSVKVNQYTVDGTFIKTWNSFSSIEKTLNYKRTCRSNCCNHRSKTSYGFIWRYY